MGTMAREMRDLGLKVSVVAAHPFYPDPCHWEPRRRPTRNVEEGIPVTRLPIYTGRAGVGQRVMQEVSHAAVLTVAAPFLGRPDLMIAVSPPFLDLIPAMLFAKLRRIPWILWLQDILPDGATATGMVEEGTSIRLARRLEMAAYRSASEIVVIADSFVDNLKRKGVPGSKLTRIYNPATVEDEVFARPIQVGNGRTVLTMGNIGFSQNLHSVVRAFEADRGLREKNVEFVLAGDGAAADRVREVTQSDRTRVTGYLDWPELERELGRASLAVVSQKYPNDSLDFNVPSKLMNFMARGLPVLAVVRPHSEVARIIRDSGCGWLVDADQLERLGGTIRGALDDEAGRIERGARGKAFAERNFRPSVLAAAMAETVRSQAPESSGPAGPPLSRSPRAPA